MSGERSNAARLFDVVNRLPFFGAGDVVNSVVRAVDGIFQLVRRALEADEAAAVEVLTEHDDPVDTVAELVKIVRNGD